MGEYGRESGARTLNAYRDDFVTQSSVRNPGDRLKTRR